MIAYYITVLERGSVLERLQPGYRAYSDRRAKLSSSRYRFRLARDIG